MKNKRKRRWQEGVEHVDLRINNVDIVEISQLSTGVDKLKHSRFREEVIKNPQGINEFILTVRPASTQQIKTALRVILRIVTPERVAIET